MEEQEKEIEQEAEKEVEKETKAETKKGLSTWAGEHPRSVFWTRLLSWTLFACVFPFTFIVWRFKLFGKISSIQIGGWGIFAIVIAAAFIFTVIRYVKLAFKGRYSLIGQVLSGVCKIILPLVVFMTILYSLKNSIDIMLQALGCVTTCELIAIPLNPLPKWAYDMQKETRDGDKKDTVDYLLTEFFKKKKEDK